MSRSEKEFAVSNKQIKLILTILQNFPNPMAIILYVPTLAFGATKFSQKNQYLCGCFQNEIH